MNYKQLNKILRYTGPTTEDDFHEMLDTNPHDHQTRLILADWLQDNNDPRAEGYRAMGQLQRHPQKDLGIHFWHSPDYKSLSVVQNDAPHAILPKEWFDAMQDDKQAVEFAGIHSASKRREMEDQAALAFGKLSPEVKAKLLKGVQ
jgi:uncharacterized protein (TIGR02996 family)